jgi:hypothetical protein
MVRAAVAETGPPRLRNSGTLSTAHLRRQLCASPKSDKDHATCTVEYKQ